MTREAIFGNSGVERSPRILSESVRCEAYPIICTGGSSHWLLEFK